MSSARDRFDARRRALRGLPALLLALAAAPAASAPDPALVRLDDLQATLALVRTQGVPLLLFFTTPGCPYCAEVRRGYLAPRARLGARAGVIVREVDITSARRFVDRDGRGRTEAAFAARFSARKVPAVVLVDDELRPLGQPLVGIGAAGFYEAYLQGAIDAAQRRLAAERG